MSYDVEVLRSRFPSLAGGTAFFDGPAGTQTPTVVAEAVSHTLTSAISNRGTVTASERTADAVVGACRTAIADLLGADPRGIVVGRSATALTYELARAIAKSWGPGDEVVVTRLDHDANIRPWVQVAQAVGATVRWAEIDPTTGELSADAVAQVLSDRTKLVAMTAASNLIGTRPPVCRVGALAHQVGALQWVDGVHATAHAGVDLAELGVDVWTCSSYKFMGPHLGLLAASPALLGRLHPDKLLASTDEVPERFELGTLPYELMAGATAAVDLIASLGDHRATDHQDVGSDAEVASRRSRVLAGMAAIEAHERPLAQRVEASLRANPRVRVHANARSRTPTLLFTVDGLDSAQVRRGLAARGVNAPAGHFYAIELSHALGLGETGGVRVGIAPYTSDDDVDRLLDALDDVIAS